MEVPSCSSDQSLSFESVEDNTLVDDEADDANLSLESGCFHTAQHNVNVESNDAAVDSDRGLPTTSSSDNNNENNNNNKSCNRSNEPSAAETPPPHPAPMPPPASAPPAGSTLQVKSKKSSSTATTQSHTELVVEEKTTTTTTTRTRTTKVIKQQQQQKREQQEEVSIVVNESNGNTGHSPFSKCDEWPPGFSFVQQEQSVLALERRASVAAAKKTVHKASKNHKQQQQQEETEEEIVFLGPEDVKADFFAHNQHLWQTSSEQLYDEESGSGVAAVSSASASLSEEPVSDKNKKNHDDKESSSASTFSSSEGGKGNNSGGSNNSSGQRDANKLPYYKRKNFKWLMTALGLILAAACVGIYVLARGPTKDEPSSPSSNNANAANSDSQLSSQNDPTTGGSTTTPGPTPAPLANDFQGWPSSSPTTAPPTLFPSLGPSAAPTHFPSVSPSKSPTTTPSGAPTSPPTTTQPSTTPTLGPSVSPTRSPSLRPSASPSRGPTQAPTTSPPTESPSTRPSVSFVPSLQPSFTPTDSPSTSSQPSDQPTVDGISRLLSLLPPYTTILLEQGDNTPPVQALQWTKGDPAIDTYVDHRLVQRFAMATFYYATRGGDGLWSAHTGWLSYDQDECEWEQVYPAHMSAATHPPCNGQQELQSLVLVNNGLAGTFPMEIGLLTSLTTLDIEANSVCGVPISLPTTLGELTLLTKLGLENNNLNGQIPTELGRLTNLEIFDLQNNGFTGSLPDELGHLVNVQYFFLQGSTFTGGVPSSFRNMTSVISADLSGTGLSGGLDEALWWPNARFINLGQNQFTGPLPTQLDGLDQLTHLDLSSNLLAGVVPPEMGDLNALQQLYLHNNPNLQGNLPTQLALLPDLQYLHVYETNLSGVVPPQVCDHREQLGFQLAVDCDELTCDCGCECPPFLVNQGWTPTAQDMPLGRCEGDCDSDADCQAGLRCWMRQGLESVPGCGLLGIGNYDYCYEPIDAPNELVSSTASTKGICQGHCNADSDCQWDLKCFTRTGMEPVLGCTGGGVSGQNYCYYDQPSASSRRLALIANDLKPEGTFPLGECFGDCDHDGDCAKGLLCYQRTGSETVPGCFGPGGAGWDYCYNPNADPANPLAFQFLEFRHDSDSQLCLDIDGGSTSNTNEVLLFGCNSQPQQHWYLDSLGHLRTALNHEKCIVGYGGNTVLGTGVMIYDCFTDDDRSKWDVEADGTIRPRNNNNVCLGASVSGDQIEMMDCSNAAAVQWTKYIYAG